MQRLPADVQDLLDASVNLVLVFPSLVAKSWLLELGMALLLIGVMRLMRGRR